MSRWPPWLLVLGHSYLMSWPSSARNMHALFTRAQKVAGVKGPGHFWIVACPGTPSRWPSQGAAFLSLPALFCGVILCRNGFSYFLLLLCLQSFFASAVFPLGVTLIPTKKSSLSFRVLQACLAFAVSSLRQYTKPCTEP
jgi:hypothetical protein